MKKRKFSTYNDGMLYVCEKINEGSDFGAVKNAVKKEDLKKKIKLAYGEMYKRDEDLDFAESQGRALSIKVKTRLHPDVNKNNEILIGDMLHSIIKLDQDRNKNEMYLYLEEVRVL